MLGELFWFGLVAILWGVGMWVAGAFVAAWVAGEKGRDPVAWFVIGLFLSPPVALLALVAAGLLRRPLGYAIGWLTQLLGVSLGVLTPGMFAVGGIFLAIWVLCFVLGKRLDARPASD